MSMLFTVNRQNNVVLRPEVLKLVPEFNKLNAKDINFVVLYADYKGPFHQLPIAERLNRSKRAVWGTMNHDVEHLEEAIENYLSLQYNPKRETIKAIIEKQEKMKAKMLEEEDPDQVRKYVTALESLAKQAEKIQEEVDYDEEMLELKGGNEMSYLEQLQHNKKLAKIHDPDFLDVTVLYKPKETGDGHTKGDY